MKNCRDDHVDRSLVQEWHDEAHALVTKIGKRLDEIKYGTSPSASDDEHDEHAVSRARCASSFIARCTKARDHRGDHTFITASPEDSRDPQPAGRTEPERERTVAGNAKSAFVPRPSEAVRTCAQCGEPCPQNEITWSALRFCSVDCVDGAIAMSEEEEPVAHPRVTMTREEFQRDPGGAMDRIHPHGCITIVDEDGDVCSQIVKPAPVRRLRQRPNEASTEPRPCSHSMQDWEIGRVTYCTECWRVVGNTERLPSIDAVGEWLNETIWRCGCIPSSGENLNPKGHAYCESCLVMRPSPPRTNEPLVQPGDPTVRHVVAWMRDKYPQNKHAREWADEIERVFLSEPRVVRSLQVGDYVRSRREPFLCGEVRSVVVEHGKTWLNVINTNGWEKSTEDNFIRLIEVSRMDKAPTDVTSTGEP